MPPQSPYFLPWYQYVSIDLFIRVAKNTFLNPILCWLYPLALRAQAFTWRMTPLRVAVAFAVVVDLFWLLIYLNAQARNGRYFGGAKEPSTEEEDQIEDVVVVTGGSSGLGQIIAEMFALKGISVAVMDIKKPQLEGNYELEYYECDISDHEAVARVARQITEDVSFSKGLS